MLTKWDKIAISEALPELQQMKMRLGVMHNRQTVSADYKRLINTLYCQVFSVVLQFEKKQAENAANEAIQAPLFETVSPDAPGMRPVKNYRDQIILGIGRFLK